VTARSEQVETDVVLRLLDHQLVGPDGSLLGNVDDLELLPDDGGWLVTGVMVGPGALSGRLPALLGRWVYAVWHRLHPDPDPSALVVPLDHVTSVDSSVHLDRPAAAALAAGFGLELWLREHVVSRLPGVPGAPGVPGVPEVTEAGAPTGARGTRGDGDGPPDGSERPMPSPRRGEPQWPVRAPAEGAHPLSRVLGRPVHSSAGTQVGRVCELRCVGPPHDERQRALPVRWLLFTPRLAGWQLGYSADPRQGPWVVRRYLRARRNRDRIVDLEQLGGLEQLDQPDTGLVLSGAARPLRPDDLRRRDG